MARDITASVVSAVQEHVVRPIIFVSLEFDSGTVRLVSAWRNVTWNGDEYVGVGDMGSISSIEETSQLRASGISMQLTGIPNDYIDEALAEEYQGRTATVWEGFLDSADQIIPDPILFFKGGIDQMGGKLGEGTSIVTLTAENELLEWERPRASYYTNAEQQVLHPGDLGLEFVVEVTEKEIHWPAEGTPR